MQAGYHYTFLQPDQLTRKYLIVFVLFDSARGEMLDETDLPHGALRWAG